MTDHASVSGHYTHGGLLGAIENGLAKLGKSASAVSIDDLAPVDEFHIGGRQASQEFLDQLGLDPEDHALDIGCGLGGPARFTASRYGCRVSGIDLTAEYVETGSALCTWVGLDERIDLQHGNALATPYADSGFDCAYMMHVGMNIPDKAALFREVHRVLKPGGRFGVYDIMRIGEDDLDFPVPWATTGDTSALATPEEYCGWLDSAGFEIAAERNRRQFALEFFEQLKARSAGSAGPPPLGLHVLMGDTAPVKIGNMIANIAAGRIAPVELIATKRR